MKYSFHFALLAILWSTSSVFAQEDRVFLAQLEPQYRLLLEDWLHTDCHVDSVSSERALLRAGRALENALVEALKLGPPNAEVAELASTSASRYELRQRWLSANGSAVDSDSLATLLAQTSDDFLADELSNQKLRWTSAAQEALSLVGSADTLKQLGLPLPGAVESR
jgi:hypothetical protein